MTMGTRIVVMKDGFIQQVDTLKTYTIIQLICSLQDLSEAHR